LEIIVTHKENKMDKLRLQELAGMHLNEAERGSVEIPKETMDRILEAMEAAIHDIEKMRQTQTHVDIVKQLHNALKLIDPHHTYKK
jgi:hypothetical protein